MFQLIAVIHALMIEVRSQGKMQATSRAKGDPYKIAKQNGWTVQTGNGTLAKRKAALLDCITVMVMHRPDYEITPYMRESIGDDVALDNAVALGLAHA